VPPKNLFGAPTQKVLRKVRKRVLKACLDVAILAELSEKKVLSATNIILFFEKRFEIQLSAGTVYPVLYALERDGKIRRLPNRRKTFYVLTSKGEEIIKDIQGSVGELYSIIDELLG
jgi:DNA-binding PadR family transcriptional regulator